MQVVAAPGRLLRIRSAALRARLHELGSLRMSRVGIAARTCRCYGIGEVWVVGFCWVGLEGFASRKEKSNTFRFFGKIRPRGFAYAGYEQSSPSAPRIPPKVLRTFATLGWFGWIIYGIAGLCVPFVYGPSGAAAWVMRVRTRSPTFSLYREEGIPNKLGRSRENLAGGRRAVTLCSAELACLHANLIPPR